MPPRKSRTQDLTESIAGQHLALSVAAHLARTQLVPEPLKVYDSQHLSEMLNMIAIALARTSALYLFDPHSGQPRQLSPIELEGAVAKRSATVLVLRDGRSLAGVSIRRGDLRQAIAILKAIGLHEIAPHLAPAASAPSPSTAEPAVTVQTLFERLAQIERDLAPPLLPPQVDNAKAAAVFIARRAPHGRVANLSMQLMSALHDVHGTQDVPGGFRMALARLRAALEAVEEQPK